jgi:DNA-binding MarR family transcriptional regulator
MLSKTLKVSPFEYYNKHLKIVNAMTPSSLSDKEIEVLATFLSLPEDITDEYMFNTVARKHVKTKLKLSDGGLSNHLISMTKKGFLTKNTITNMYAAKPFVNIAKGTQEYSIKLVLDE